MVARSILLRHLRSQNISLASHPFPIRCITTTAANRAQKQKDTPKSGSVANDAQASTSTTSTTSSSSSNPEPEQQKSWLTRKVESSPAVRSAFLAFTGLLGYNSKTQVAGRQARAFYEDVCAVRPDEDREFWQKDCFLPPTFQSWFTVTNLHIWMLTVRLRALPPDHGKAYQQALIDHFFIDIEDRIRTVLQPPSEPQKPYTFESTFYTNPNKVKAFTADGKPKILGKAPDRLVNSQMKIFKEQWMGMGISCDLGLVRGDQELAGAIWRNLLGARGAQGIAYPDSKEAKTFRRAVNLVGGEVVNVAKIDLEKEETKDDGSGVHDFEPAEVDKYLTYPQVMLDLVGYIRRELARLEKVSDEDILNGRWEKLRFGRVKN
ncbi:hypothetical protein D9613_008963 [Agrocybe pediades]|uniref:Ubiquinol-cytochrome c chaperone domain-containing protein n=1 Tax=Agrocybe pediades TaxID=84607 RepID=A0A8H4R4W5_9AGAR|nr:hypothetical protein D9613_008963 [Agrocybe pediades]